jgi:hypothetical protein
MKEDEIGDACSIGMKEMRYSCENMKYEGIDGRTILAWKYNMRTWNEFLELRSGTKRGQL